MFGGFYDSENQWIIYSLMIQYNTINFIETRFQNTIGTVIRKTDGLVNRLASNLVISNQPHRVAWLIGQEKILK